MKEVRVWWPTSLMAQRNPPMSDKKLQNKFVRKSLIWIKTSWVTKAARSRYNWRWWWLGARVNTKEGQRPCQLILLRSVLNICYSDLLLRPVTQISLLRPVTKISYWDLLLRPVTLFSYWDLLLRSVTEICYWDLLLRSVTEICYWDLLLRSVSEICDWDLLLRSVTRICYWDLLLTSWRKPCMTCRSRPRSGCDRLPGPRTPRTPLPNYGVR